MQWVGHIVGYKKKQWWTEAEQSAIKKTLNIFSYSAWHHQKDWVDLEKSLCARDKVKHQYWMPVIFVPSDGNALKTGMLLSQNSLRNTSRNHCLWFIYKCKLVHVKKKPYVTIVTLKGANIFLKCYISVKTFDVFSIVNKTWVYKIDKSLHTVCANSYRTDMSMSRTQNSTRLLNVWSLCFILPNFLYEGTVSQTGYNRTQLWSPNRGQAELLCKRQKTISKCSHLCELWFWK